jgi:hypothetical protein
MEKAMAQAIPTILASLPTAQPTPAGQVATLSQNDLAGTWDGWITIEVVSLKGASPEDQKACDEQLGFIKGRPIPSSMEFEPQGAGAGTVRIKSEEGEEPEGEVLPYTYRNGVITISVEQDQARGSFEGKTIRTESGYAMTGTWKSDAAASPDEMVPADAVTITGNWVMEKPRR